MRLTNKKPAGRLCPADLYEPFNVDGANKALLRTRAYCRKAGCCSWLSCSKRSAVSSITSFLAGCREAISSAASYLSRAGAAEPLNFRWDSSPSYPHCPQMEAA